MQLEKAHSSSCHQEKRLCLSSSPGVQKESDDTHRGCRRAETGGIWTKSTHERKQQSKNSQPGSWWLVLVKRNIFINCLFIFLYCLLFPLKKKKVPFEKFQVEYKETKWNCGLPSQARHPEGSGPSRSSPMQVRGQEKCVHQEGTKLCSVHVRGVLEAHWGNALLPP